MCQRKRRASDQSGRDEKRRRQQAPDPPDLSERMCGHVHVRFSKALLDAARLLEDDTKFNQDLKQQISTAIPKIDFAVCTRIPQILKATQVYLAPDNVANDAMVKAELTDCFSLVPDNEERFRHYCTVIGKIFEMIADGLQAAYVLVLDYSMLHKDIGKGAGWVRFRPLKAGKPDGQYPIGNIIYEEAKPRLNFYRGSIHLDLMRLGATNDVGHVCHNIMAEAAALIIHEASHKFVGTLDHFYISTDQAGEVSIELTEHGRKFAGTEGQATRPMKVVNADTFAYFALRMAKLAIDRGL